MAVRPIEIYGGSFLNKIPGLLNDGYTPAGVGTIFDQRMHAPEDIGKLLKGGIFFTGDSVGIDKTGEVALTLDAQLLRIKKEDRDKVRLYGGALQLERDEWEALKSDHNSIIMSPREVEDAAGRGVRKKSNGLWLPVNDAVAKALGHYLRGKSFEDKDFQTHAQMVSSASGGSEEVLRQYFDRSRPSQLLLRSLVLGGCGYGSSTHSNYRLDDNLGCLAGVAQKGTEFLLRPRDGVTAAPEAQGNIRESALNPYTGEFLAERQRQIDFWLKHLGR